MKELEKIEEMLDRMIGIKRRYDQKIREILEERSAIELELKGYGPGLGKTEFTENQNRLAQLDREIKERVEELRQKLMPFGVEDIYKGKLAVMPKRRDPWKNLRLSPLHALDSLLLHRIGGGLGGKLEKKTRGEAGKRARTIFIVPAYSKEIELVEHGKLVAITPKKGYLGKAELEDPRVVPLIKRFEEVTPEELGIDKEGETNTVLILKGINTILDKEELEKIISRLNPDAIALFGTFHGKDRHGGFEGVPIIDNETHNLIRELGYEETTHKYFKDDELKRIEGMNKKFAEHFAPRAGYFFATRVKVFERPRR